MSTVAPVISTSCPVVSHENLLFDYPEADVILRSRDSYEFRVLKLYIVHSSLILGQEVLISSPPNDTSDSEREGATSADALPVVELPLSGAILFSLLSYIFPVPPVLPSNEEQTMELLSVAQKYKMDVVLTHIRNHIAQHDPPFIREETAFLIYSLAQQYGLRHEALKAARSTLDFSTLTVVDLLYDDTLRITPMPGDVLDELWKYHKRVRSNLTSDLEEFRMSNAHVELGDSSCVSLTDLGIPFWINRYITSIGTTPIPAFVDLTGFHIELAKHIQRKSQGGGDGCTSCANIPNKTMVGFWKALKAVVHGSITKAESDFALVVEGISSESQARSSSSNITSPPKYSDMSNADIILQSSDLIDFHVHRSVLAASSPFFRDMFSLPQPSNDESPHGLPIVHSPEDAEVLNSLISMLYPVPPDIPDSNDSILALLAAAQKYDMVTVQTFIRAEVSRRGLLSPTHAEAFRMYAVACRRRLIPEMENAARLTLEYPLTFESLGEALRSFEGWALHDLADFHRHCKYEFFDYFHSFLTVKSRSKMWVGCPSVHTSNLENDEGRLPTWLESLFRNKFIQEDAMALSQTILKSQRLEEEYLEALQAHINETDCHSCMKVHVLKGDTFCSEIKMGLKLVQNVPYPIERT